MNKRKGFTLLELLLVIFIIGILATAALTAFGPQVRRGAYLAEARSNISVIRSACEAYKQQFGTYPTLTKITTDGGVGSTSVKLLELPTSTRWTYTIDDPGDDAYTITATKTGEPFDKKTITVDQSGEQGGTILSATK